MAITNPGLIHLLPNTPNDQQTQLINDNFTTLNNIVGAHAFKIALSGTYVTTQSYATTNPGAGKFGTDSFLVTTIAHGLGYVPAILAYLNNGGQYNPLPYTFYQTAGAGAQGYWSTFSTYADATNLYITLTSQSYGGTTTFLSGFSIKYFLLQETAN